jgi:hypothetical protein
MTMNEITFDNLHPQETILIETVHSAYTFSVVDAVNRDGLLTGGILGTRTMRANFLGSFSMQKTCRVKELGKVKVGSQAIFLYCSEGGQRHLITSPIIRLVHTVRGSAPEWNE